MKSYKEITIAILLLIVLPQVLGENCKITSQEEKVFTITITDPPTTTPIPTTTTIENVTEKDTTTIPTTTIMTTTIEKDTTTTTEKVTTITSTMKSTTTASSTFSSTTSKPTCTSTTYSNNICQSTTQTPTTQCPLKKSLNIDNTMSRVIHNNKYSIEILRTLSDCNSHLDGSILLSETHCRRYYVCQRGKAVVLRCSLGHWFDRQTWTCRPRNMVTNCPANRN